VAVEIFKWMQRRTARPSGSDRDGDHRGIAAALFTAFTRTFWENALEAETYGLASLVVISRCG